MLGLKLAPIHDERFRDESTGSPNKAPYTVERRQRGRGMTSEWQVEEVAQSRAMGQSLGKDRAFVLSAPKDAVRVFESCSIRLFAEMGKSKFWFWLLAPPST